jgi:S-DNA-T family DNA segregation ATPase FtsK/SpoIIIE
MRFFASKSSAKSKSSSKKGAPPPAPQPAISLDTWLDMIGIAMLGIAAFTLLGLVSTQRSGIISGWLDFVNLLFGWGAYLAPLLLGVIGLYLLIRRFGDKFPKLAPMRLAGAVLAYFTALATLHAIAMISTQQDGQVIADAMQGGGQIGWVILNIFSSIVGNVGAAFVLIVMWFVSSLLIAQVSFSQLVNEVQNMLTRQPGAGRPTDDIIEPDYGRRDVEPRDDGELVINGLKPRRPTSKRPVDLPEPDEDEVHAPRQIAQKPAPRSAPAPKLEKPKPEPNKLPPPRIIGAPPPGYESTPDRPLVINGLDKSKAKGDAASARQAPPEPQPAPPVPQISSVYSTSREWKLPKIDEMLEPGSDASLKEADIRQRAAVIEDTLKAFGVPGRVVEVNRGPTITQFGVEPGFVDMKGGRQIKVKVSRIAALADDLALALAAPRIRIEAPVPGRSIVGIEVPNGETSLVSLRDVMESEEFERLERKTRLRMGLGQDVSGHPVVADLTTMPHMLIAGTTGSGKSVCVNAIITAMLCYNTPDDLRFLMIDPKRVELTGYNGIPHLISPVVVDLEKTTSVLNWTAREMDSRYRMFAKHGVRNIVDFNTKVASIAGKTQDPELQRKLPYIILVIDELADLMMMAPDETEKIICRLAQMARATGIHLILATQRPSVDVVTGLIKANFPARIAFTVATTVDSRVIIDGPGAEKLLGRGDMLVVTPEQSMPMRAQGCFLNEKEITRVVRHWRGQLGQNAGTDPMNTAMVAPSLPMKSLDTDPAVLPTPDLFSTPNTWDEARALDEAAKDVGGAGGSKDDKLFNDAVATVRLQGKASISLLQRRLRIGYTRAARLIEEMEERGIVGPQVAGQQHREVLNSPLSGSEE